jgi:hypothetical protein
LSSEDTWVSLTKDGNRVLSIFHADSVCGLEKVVLDAMVHCPPVWDVPEEFRASYQNRLMRLPSTFS